MADDVLNKVEKQIEGTNLALAAVAEVLQKMDARLSNDEEAELRKAEADQAQSEKTALVKEIAGEVALLLADQGMDVDGTKVRSAAKTGKTAGGADDSEKPANVKSNIADQQATIQAMRKEKEEEEEDMPAAKGGYMKGGDDEDAEADDDMTIKAEAEDEGSEEYPKVENAEDGEEEDADDDEITAMAKELKALKKQIAGYEKSIEKAVTTETESRLRKMGFKEENGLQRPQIVDTPLGTDGATPIVKNSPDTVGQLSELSYKQLRDLQAQIEMGNTDGVPKELLG